MVTNVSPKPTLNTAPVNTVERSDLSELLNRLSQNDLAPTISEIAEATGYSEDQIRHEKNQLLIEKKLQLIESQLAELNARNLANSPKHFQSNLQVIFDFLRNPGDGGTIIFGCIGAALIILSFWWGIRLVK